MRIVFIGSVDFSTAALERVLSLPDAEVVGIVTGGSVATNADFRSLEPIAAARGIPCLAMASNDQAAMAAWIGEKQPDVVFCFGWSRLLSRAVLGIPRLGIIGYHPTLLPRNRGRHPIIWALALGLTETGSTFFYMDEGADSGDILDQELVAIASDDDAATLYRRLTQVALGQISRFVPLLADGRAPRRPQDPAEASSWRKRGKRDGEIDWRMPATGIHNLVRALTRPYLGAHFVRNGQDIKVWRSRVAATATSGDAEPGKVLAVSGGAITVQCGTGIVTLVEHALDEPLREGDYL